MKYLQSILMMAMLSCSGPETGKVALVNVEVKDTVEERTKTDNVIHIQELFTEEVNVLVNTMAVENYTKALIKVDEAGKKGIAGSIPQAFYRYVRLEATTALVGKGIKTRMELHNVLRSDSGKYLLVNHHEITKGVAMPFNQVRVEEDSIGYFKATISNNAGTQIHFFLHLEHDRKIDLSKNIGKHAYVIGKLYKFRLSEKEINSWIAEIWLKDGSFIILEDEWKKSDI